MLHSLLFRGMTVLIILKQDQRRGKLTKDLVKDILTSSPSHPHGIKVRLVDGQVGRVQEIVKYVVRDATLFRQQSVGRSLQGTGHDQENQFPMLF